MEFVAENMEMSNTSWIFIHPGHRSPTIQTRDALSIELGVSRVGHAVHKVETGRLIMGELGDASFAHYVHLVHVV